MFSEHIKMIYLESYMATSDRVNALLTLPDPNRVLAMPMFAFLTRPNREHHHYIIKQILAAQISHVITLNQAEDMYDLANNSLALYESLSEGVRDSTDEHLAKVASQKILNSYTLKK